MQDQHKKRRFTRMFVFFAVTAAFVGCSDQTQLSVFESHADLVHRADSLEALVQKGLSNPDLLNQLGLYYCRLYERRTQTYNMIWGKPNSEIRKDEQLIDKAISLLEGSMRSKT